MRGGEPVDEPAQRLPGQVHRLRPVQLRLQPLAQVALHHRADGRRARFGQQPVRPADVLAGAARGRFGDLADVEQQHVHRVQLVQVVVAEPLRTVHPHPAAAVELGAQRGEVRTVGEAPHGLTELEQVLIPDRREVDVAAVQQQPAEAPGQVRRRGRAAVTELDQPVGVPGEQVQVDPEPTPAAGRVEQPGVLASQQQRVVQADTTDQGQVDQVAAGLMRPSTQVAVQPLVDEPQPHRQRRGEPVAQVRPRLDEPAVGAHPLPAGHLGRHVRRQPCPVGGLARVHPPAARAGVPVDDDGGGGPSRRPGHRRACSAARYSARTASSEMRV